MENNIQSQKKTVTNILSKEEVKNRFKEILGNNSTSFISSIISSTKANPKLLECDVDSVISSSVIAATLKLPIEQNLGFAYIVPYNKKVGGEYVSLAQFILGYKGLLQLAIRTGQYSTINASEVYEGEFVSENRITGEVVIDANKKASNKIVGYVAYFKLKSGFEKYSYWTVDKVKKHAEKYSKTFGSEYGIWTKNELEMSIKTVLKSLLSKYGILSVEMQTALIADQSVINDAETLDVDYVDNSPIESSALDEKDMPKIEIKTSDKQKDEFDKTKTNKKN